MNKLERMKELINILNNASNAYYNQIPITFLLLEEDITFLKILKKWTKL